MENLEEKYMDDRALIIHTFVANNGSIPKTELLLPTFPARKIRNVLDYLIKHKHEDLVSELPPFDPSMEFNLINIQNLLKTVQSAGTEQLEKDLAAQLQDHTAHANATKTILCDQLTEYRKILAATMKDIRHDHEKVENARERLINIKIDKTPEVMVRHCLMEKLRQNQSQQKEEYVTIEEVTSIKGTNLNEQFSLLAEGPIITTTTSTNESSPYEIVRDDDQSYVLLANSMENVSICSEPEPAPNTKPTRFFGFL